MVSPELIGHAPEIAELLGLVTIALAFTQRQKNWIKERDGNKCQATFKHDCNQDKYPLEVDHLLPQRYLASQGVPLEYIDRPENALTKCRAAHDAKHPDRIPARQTYHQAQSIGMDTFKQLFEERVKKLAERKVYWSTDHDRSDTVRALKLTAMFRAKGKEWPEKKK